MVQVPREWLTERVPAPPTSYQQNLPPDAALKSRMAWQRLERDAQEGDELWAFSSPPRGGRGPSRYTGYALVRDGRVLKSEVVTGG